MNSPEDDIDPWDFTIDEEPTEEEKAREAFSQLSEEEKGDIFAQLRQMVNRPLDENKVREDMFYDILSDSGYSRREVDSMGLKPWNIDIEEWSQEELIGFIRKWLSKITQYYTEEHYNDDGSITIEFCNAIKTMLLGYVAVSVRAKRLKDEVEDDVHKVDLPMPLGHSLEWAIDTTLSIAEQLPKMKVPEVDEPLNVGPDSSCNL